MTDYDVSMVDRSLAYMASNQLLLANADGSNRRVLIDGGTGPDLRGFYGPVFSPDGGTLAYAHNGLNLYSVSTGVSNSVRSPPSGERRARLFVVPVERFEQI